jgi:hypothetical protein
MSGTEVPVKLPDSTPIEHARTNKKRCPLRANMPGLLILNKFRSRVSEAASPNRCCSHAALLSLNLAGLRRGLARKTHTKDENESSYSCRRGR